ncbi:hypothetical protein JF66_00345 [Cryobacterium sp. MLB-32]|uniref:flagellar hook-length control protein FliK n=1 Tax=Cryobacterium sp. MLB-32 TaxID=1529318 RepID=UPI0004E727CB|nr:flagellar hook-length control protein FliK [Cryobacterium sp. MLB-32]KFF61075.1 hypothetical protein JF66_00345 [Cryobacterium sp. MLB-32]
MTFSLNSSLARPAAQTGGQGGSPSGTARVGSSERAAGFAAVMKRTGSDSSAQNAADREATGSTSAATAHSSRAKSPRSESVTAGPTIDSVRADAADSVTAAGEPPTGSEPTLDEFGDASVRPRASTAERTDAATVEATAAASPIDAPAPTFAWPVFSRDVAATAAPSTAVAGVAGAGTIGTAAATTTSAATTTAAAATSLVTAGLTIPAAAPASAQASVQTSVQTSAEAALATRVRGSLDITPPPAPGTSVASPTRTDASAAPQLTALPAALPAAVPAALPAATPASAGAVLPQPAGTAPRTDFLIRPTGATAAEAVTIVQADAAASASTSLAAAAVGPAAPAALGAPMAPAAIVTPTAAAVPVPLTTQVAKPLFTLSGVKPGEHVLTITVTPENLGPLTVRAHVTGDNIRVELFAPTDSRVRRFGPFCPTCAGTSPEAGSTLSLICRPRARRTTPDRMLRTAACNGRRPEYVTAPVMNPWRAAPAVLSPTLHRPST